MNFLDENGLGRLWAQIVLKLNSKVPDGGTTGQILKKTETGTEWADESCAADAVQSNLDTHVNNTNIHVTAEEKSVWNAKLDSYTETDPTVPAWAKAASKPTYTASEVGADVSGSAASVQTNLDTHVNNTAIHVTDEEKSAWNAKLDSYTETDPTVPNWAKQLTKPTYTADEVGAAPASHVEDATAHVTADEKSAWNESISIVPEAILPNSKGGYYMSICYGNDKFVAMPNNTSYPLYSYDGISWQYGNTLGYPQWGKVVYADGKFVTVSPGVTSNNLAAYSTDGINWTKTTLPAKSMWKPIAYGNGKFVTVATNSDYAAYSTDGINWTQTTLPVVDTWYSMAFGDDKFVVVAAKDSTTSALYSTDGINWTQIALPNGTTWYSIAYGNGKFVAVSHGATLKGSTIAAYSTDGITWTQTTLPTKSAWKSVCYGNNKFVAVSGDSTNAAYSMDGINWVETALPMSVNWECVTYGDGKFVVIAQNNINVAYSYDGITWLHNPIIINTVSKNNVTETTKTILGISDKQDKLTGTAGQMVGFDENGNAIAKDMTKSAASYTATLTTSGWAQSGDRYAQTVNVTGVTASTPVVLVDVALSGADLDADAAVLEAWQYPSANNVAQGDGTLTFYSYEVPAVNIPINVGVC